MKQLKSHPPPGTSCSLSASFSRPPSHITLSWTISLFFSSSPLSSRGGINFNDRFVADREDRRGNRERIRSTPSHSVSSQIERLCCSKAQLHIVSRCFSLCVIHYAFDIMTVASAVPKQRTAKDGGCRQILEQVHLCSAG